MIQQALEFNLAVESDDVIGEAFVPRGYAVVVVDVRGTGASFGTRDSFRSPRAEPQEFCRFF